MIKKEMVSYCLDALKKAGADKAACSMNMMEKKELNVEIGEMTLLRTTFNNNMGISVIKDQKKGSTSINKTDKESIDTAVAIVMAMAEGSQPDDAYDIAEKQPSKFFSKGDESANLDTMYQSLEEFVDYVKSTYPKIQLEAAIMDFNHSKSFFQNTNGVDFEIREGMYGFSPMFLSKEGKNTSSFNGTGFTTLKVEKPLYEYGSIDTLLKQSVEQLHTQNISDKFVGHVVVTPDCIGDFLGFITADISDGKMISGNSVYSEKLNEKITHPKLTFHSRPVSNEIVDGYFITSDGYVAENSTIVDKGILKTHLLGIYGAKKLSKNRAVNDGGAYIVDAGDKPYAEIIKNIDQGVLLARFSGGNPANNGDFSGVAKNSYYIEKGEIKHPLTETMVSGNIQEMFENLDEISSDRIDFGSGILPWISFKGITVS
jgi:PmbA protein